MKTVTSILVAAVSAAMVTACAAPSSAPPQAASGTVYRGEVWNWDERENTVTLRNGTQITRYRVAPGQISGLRLHETTTIRGVPAGPAEIVTTTTPATAVRAVPRGPVEQAEVTGSVTAVDPQGTLAVTTARGPLTVWTAQPGQTRFTAGAPVKVRVSVQSVDLVPLAQSGAQASPALEPTAPVAGTEPGEYAMVTGRVVAADPSGVLTVDSPRGPIKVWVSDASRYPVNSSVQVRTSVHPAS
jgi:hypothetical protein